MPFKLSLMNKDPSGAIHLLATGDATANDFNLSQPPHFESLLGADWAAQRVLLNMGNVADLDSAAIGWLIETQKQFRTHGGLLVLHSVQTPVRNILNLLKIERVVPMAPDATAARVLLVKHSRADHAALTR